MAKAGKVRHWKHGWIPVSPQAKAYAAGKGPKPVTGKARERLPKPGDPDWSPNNEFGISSSKRVRDDRLGSERRVRDLQQVAPGVGFLPDRQFPSQNIPAHYTGGVVLPPDEADKLLDMLQRTREGTSSRLEAQLAAGGVNPASARRLSAMNARGNKSEQAQRRARRLAQALDLKSTPSPDYQMVNETVPGSGRNTGGLKFTAAQADELIRKLNARHAGTMTHYQARRAAGVRD